MPALNFQARFADAVESGRKTQTIRAVRKRPFRVGDRVVCYVNQRSSKCRKLCEGVVVWVAGVEFCGTGVIFIDGYRLNLSEAIALTLADGFESVDDMVAWFREQHGLPFRGQVVRWDIRQKQPE